MPQGLEETINGVRSDIAYAKQLVANALAQVSSSNAAATQAYEAAQTAQTAATQAGESASQAAYNAQQATAAASERLLTVSHDSTLSGDGTTLHPLHVVSGGGGGGGGGIPDVPAATGLSYLRRSSTTGDNTWVSFNNSDFVPSTKTQGNVRYSIDNYTQGYPIRLQAAESTGKIGCVDISYDFVRLYTIGPIGLDATSIRIVNDKAYYCHTSLNTPPAAGEQIATLADIPSGPVDVTYTSQF